MVAARLLLIIWVKFGAIVSAGFVRVEFSP